MYDSGVCCGSVSVEIDGEWGNFIATVVFEFVQSQEVAVTQVKFTLPNVLTDQRRTRNLKFTRIITLPKM